jgi:hypothetical protein
MQHKQKCKLSKLPKGSLAKATGAKSLNGMPAGRNYILFCQQNLPGSKGIPIGFLPCQIA